MPRSTAAWTAALLAVALPLGAPALATGPAARWPVPAVALLLAAPVVLLAGRSGHRAAGRAVRAGTVSGDVLVSAATLTALAWAVPPAVSSVLPALSSAVSAGLPAELWSGLSAAGPGPVPDASLTGPAVLPGAAAVLTLVSRAVRDPGPGHRGPDGGRVAAGLQVAADRWCARFGPVVLLAAAAVAAFRAGAGQPVAVAVPAGIAVLLAACPCGPAAAVPAALRSVPGRPRRTGGGSVRLPPPVPRTEVPGRGTGQAWCDPVGWTVPDGGPVPVDRIDTVVLAGPDVLTGTGAARITVHPAEGTDPEQALRLAASVSGGVAAGSDLGPLARALRAAVREGGGAPDVAEPDEQPGLGVSGLVAELVRGGPDQAGAGTVVAHAVLLGSPGWLLEHGIALPPEVARARERAEAEGRSVVAVAWDGTARAVLVSSRSPHPAAVPGIAALRAAGTEPVLLTPDDDGAARALGAAAGLDPADPDAVRPGLGPAGRAAAVAGLRVRGRTVAVAADPRTDAAALAGADLPVVLIPWPDTGPDDGAAVREREPAGFAVRGGPGDVAAALVLARRARRAAATGLRTGLVAGGIGTVVAVAGVLPAPAAALVPVLAAVAVTGTVRWRVRPPGRRRAPGSDPDGDPHDDPHGDPASPSGASARCSASRVTYG